MLKGQIADRKSRTKELADILNAADFTTGVGPKLKTDFLMRGVASTNAGVFAEVTDVRRRFVQLKTAFHLCLHRNASPPESTCPRPQRRVWPCLLKGPKG